MTLNPIKKFVAIRMCWSREDKKDVMSMSYIIGDIHGEYQKLLTLVEKLPKDAKLIFVGDLIDRGLQSREVVAYLRKSNHQVIRRVTIKTL